MKIENTSSHNITNSDFYIIVFNSKTINFNIYNI